jgi:hypothetical protein
LLTNWTRVRRVGDAWAKAQEERDHDEVCFGTWYRRARGLGFGCVGLAGWQTWGGYGVAANTDISIAAPVGTQIVGVEWIGLTFNTLNGSFLSELVLSVNDSINGTGGFWDFNPSATDAGGTYGPLSGTFADPALFGSGPFTMATSTIYVEAYESFNDGGNAVQDAQITAGTLRITYIPVPTPGVLALAGIGGLAAFRRRR